MNIFEVFSNVDFQRVYNCVDRKFLVDSIIPYLGISEMHITCFTSQDVCYRDLAAFMEFSMVKDVMVRSHSDGLVKVIFNIDLSKLVGCE